MKGRGRPLRFLATVIVGWIGFRVAMLWPQAGSLPAAIDAALPLVRAGPRVMASVPSAIAASPRTGVTRPKPVADYPVSGKDGDSRLPLAPSELLPFDRASLETLQFAPFPVAAMAVLPNRLDPLPDRWSLGMWIVARSGGAAGTAPGGQIGGGQAGMRGAWRISSRHRIAAYGRLAAPLSGRGREAALGIEWQPVHAPVRLMVERRFGFDGDPDGTGLGAIAGIDAEWRGFRLEAYGQAGAVLRRRADPYADGAMRGTHVLDPAGAARIGLGAGVWGAAQRDAQRLDIGPSATLAVRNLRFALDWRQRIAGEARPESGVALTMGADF